MATDPHVIEAVRRADPVPDVERLPQPRRSAIGLLALAGKESTVKTLDPKHTTLSPSPRGPRRRALLAFAAAAAVTLAAIGVVALLADDETVPPAAATTTQAPDPTTTTEAATTETPDPTTTTEAATATTTTTQVPPSDPLAGSWEARQLEFGVAAVHATDLGFVALGTRTVSLSTDGVSWDVSLETPFEPLDPQPQDLLPGEPPLGRIESHLSRAAVEYDGSLVVFGSVATDIHSGAGSVEHFMWRTSDGATWTQTPVTTIMTGMGGVQDAAAIGTRLIATMLSESGTIVFVTDDGTDWTMLEPADSGLGGVQLARLTVHGGFAAIGGDPSGQHALYRSVDGTSWMRVDGSEFAASEYPTYSIASHGESMYVGGAVLLEEGFAPALWMSTGTGRFERVALDPSLDGGWGFVDAIEPTDRGLFVLAWQGATEDAPSRIVMHAGDDAATLSVMPDTESLFTGANDAGTLAYDGSRLVVAASVATGPEWTPWSWIWTADA